MSSLQSELVRLEYEIVNMSALVDKMPTEQWALINERLRSIRTSIQQLRMKNAESEPKVVHVPANPQELNDWFNVDV